MRNSYLEKLLAEKGMNNEDVWSSIFTNEGSVQHLDFLSDEEKDVFKTAFEIDQRWLIEHAGDRSQFICQAQSLNVFLPANVHKKDLHAIHWAAWAKGLNPCIIAVPNPFNVPRVPRAGCAPKMPMMRSPNSWNWAAVRQSPNMKNVWRANSKIIQVLCIRTCS